jgi:surface polysaccharide O-acyltransferase-like enzyme
MKANLKVTQRNTALDILKICLAFMVVAMHTGFLSDISKTVSYFLNEGIFRIAVPIFLIINGYYFGAILEKKRTSNWFKRVLVLYAIWMLIYAYWWLDLQGGLQNLALLAFRILFGYFHLWYLSAMICAAALLLVILKYNLLSHRLMIYISLVLYFIGSMINYTGNYHFFEGTLLDILFNKPSIHRNFLFLGFPFFFAGYYLSKVNKSYSAKTLIYAMVIGLILMYLEVTTNYLNNVYAGGFDNLITLPLVCIPVTLLIFRMEFLADTKNIASYSTGIYLSHKLFITILVSSVGIYATKLTFIAIVCSVLFTYLILKTKYLKKYIL